MASSIYSHRFAGAAISASTTVVYTVPAGYLAIVRDIDVVLTSGTAAIFQVAIGGVALFARRDLSSTVTAGEWRGRQVLNAGETLVVVLSAATAEYSISGYLLTV